MGFRDTRFRGTYASVSPEGEIRVPTTEDDPMAVRRDWKSADDKESGTKYEKIYSEIFGYITDIFFKEGEYGTSLQVTIHESGEDTIFTMPIKSNFSQDFLGRLPNVDLTKEVIIQPYAYISKKTKKEVKGCGITQLSEDGSSDDKKIDNFFTSYDEVAKKFIYSNGFPEPQIEDGVVMDKETKTKFWTDYFFEVRKFLRKYVEENVVPKIPEEIPNDFPVEGAEPMASDDDIKVDDIPFDGEPKEETKK